MTLHAIAPYTPGPWRSEPLGAGYWIVGPNGEQVAVVYGPAANERSEGNVALVFAAPQMRALLLRVDEALSNACDPVPGSDNPLEAIRAEIAALVTP